MIKKLLRNKIEYLNSCCTAFVVDETYCINQLRATQKNGRSGMGSNFI